MSNYNHQVVFRYPHDSKKLLPEVYTSVSGNTVLIDEAYISSKLDVIFIQTHIQIDEVMLTIEVHETKLGSHFEVELSIVSPEIDFNVKDSDSNFDYLIHRVIDKTILYVYKEKDRKVS